MQHRNHPLFVPDTPGVTSPPAAQLRNPAQDFYQSTTFITCKCGVTYETPRQPNCPKCRLAWYRNLSLEQLQCYVEILNREIVNEEGIQKRLRDQCVTAVRRKSFGWGMTIGVGLTIAWVAWYLAR